MKPLQVIFNAIIRYGLMLVIGYLVRHKIIDEGTLSTTDLAEIVALVAGGLAVLWWAVYTRIKAHFEQLVALKLPKDSHPSDVKAVVADTPTSTILAASPAAASAAVSAAKAGVVIFACMFLFSGCAAVDVGQDQVVVNAERDTRLAADTFDLLVHLEYDQRTNLKAINPTVGSAVKKEADMIRLHSKEWLRSARLLTMQYKYHRTPDTEKVLRASLETALATLSAAVTEAQKYLGEINSVTKAK